MKPIIGITCSCSEDELSLPLTYVKSVEKTGGLPIILPAFRDEELASAQLTAIDGLLLSGGVDVAPGHFGADPAPKLGAVSPDRDHMELAVTRLALDQDLPILAICRGIQLLNVAAGGTVIQDIESAVKEPLQHRQEAPRWHASHRVTVEYGSRVQKLVAPDSGSGEDCEVWVNSFHHQAIERPARGFRVTATAPDGIIEAVEGTEHRFVLGVQWHPEGMWERHPHFLHLFSGLVRADGGTTDETGK